MNVQQIVKTQLIQDEGLRLKPYTDQKGKLTIGYGRNLTDIGINQKEADIMLDDDIAGASLDALSLFPNLFDLDEKRQAVLINMIFNMGKATLSGFRQFRQAIADKDFQVAAGEMENSAWFHQVGARAQRLINIMRGL